MVSLIGSVIQVPTVYEDTTKLQQVSLKILALIYCVLNNRVVNSWHISDIIQIKAEGDTKLCYKNLILPSEVSF